MSILKRLLNNRPYFIAEKYEKEGKITEAIQIYWELINNNQMGRHPYDRLRIIYAKRKDWNSAIKTCQKFIDAVKSGKQTRNLMKKINKFFETSVEVSRIRVGKRQTIETLINEESSLLAKFLRDERETWTPRIAIPQYENETSFERTKEG